MVVSPKLTPSPISQQPLRYSPMKLCLVLQSLWSKTYLFKRGFSSAYHRKVVIGGGEVYRVLRECYDRSKH